MPSIRSRSSKEEGIGFEERDLVAQFGDQYRRYRERAGMLLPWTKGRSSTPLEKKYS